MRTLFIVQEQSFMIIIVVMLLSVVAILAIYSWLKSSRRKRIRYFIRTRSIVELPGTPLPDLQVAYNGENITKELFVSRIGIWNRGRETIRSEDIDPSAPIRIMAAAGSRIHEVKPLYTSGPENSVTVIIAPDQLSVQLDIASLRSKGEIAIQILHSGEGELQVEGRLLGDDNGVKELILTTPHHILLWGNIFIICPFMLAAVMYTMWMMSLPDKQWLRTILTNASIWDYLASFLFICIYFGAVIMGLVRIYEGQLPLNLRAQMKYS